MSTGIEQRCGNRFATQARIVVDDCIDALATVQPAADGVDAETRSLDDRRATEDVRVLLDMDIARPRIVCCPLRKITVDQAMTSTLRKMSVSPAADRIRPAITTGIVAATSRSASPAS